MVDYMSRLPDEVVCHILSFLTVKDAVRARLSSPRWLRLPDSRSVLQFDQLSVLGKENFGNTGPKFQSMFVRIVNRFLKLWIGNRVSKLVVDFCLGNENASHIDRWIATSITMEVEEIELDFTAVQQEKYVFPCHLLCFGKAPYLKQLSLCDCTMSLSSQCTSWLSNLTTLNLRDVPVHQSGWQHILSAGSNLISLVFNYCSLPRSLFINGQLVCLKKLIILDELDAIKLNCPNLEVFNFKGLACRLCFAHVPNLREASVWFRHDNRWCSKTFNHVTRNAPQLEALTLRITTEVQPFPATLARISLKRLNLQTKIPIGFDLLTITYMLNASPFLETLELELYYIDFVKSSKQREYPDHPHVHLKEAKIKGFEDRWNQMEFAVYLVRNAMTLQHMVIECPKWLTEVKQKARTLLLQKKINPTAEIIII